MLYVRKFTIVLLSAIFLTLISYSAQSVAADHVEPLDWTEFASQTGDGTYKNYGDVTIVPTRDSKYKIHLQLILRTGDGQLINVTESTKTAAFIPHRITDHVFDTLMGKKEIITIDNVTYEKVQYMFTPTLEHRFMGLYPIFTEDYNLEFESTSGAREKMREHQEFALWKIHYCATFEGHGFSCIPVFQDLVPNMTLEQHDVVSHQWTILRVLN
jgi:hypothetical protein